MSTSGKSIKPESSGDEADAFALAELVRTGRARKVPRSRANVRMAKLRILAATYTKLTGDVVRCKNRIQVLYRSRGVKTPVGDPDLYSPKHRAQWLGALPTPCRLPGELLFAELDGLRAVRERAHKELVAEAKNHSGFSVLMTCPGLGEIRVAQLLAVVITPHRFRTKRQFWGYCGFGVRSRTSAEWAKDERGKWQRSRQRQILGLSKKGHRTLKAVLVGAAVQAIRSNAEVRANYARLTSGSTDPSMARLTIARKLAAVILSMWKHEGAYQPGRFAPAA